MSGILIGFLWVVYVFVCLLLMFIILIQRGETGGLSSAFGGGGGDTAFGVRADTTWKKATAFFAALFFGLSIVLGAIMTSQNKGSVAANAAAAAPAEAPAPTPAPAPAPAPTPAPAPAPNGG
jgi:preprotein translocase subunit SecG